MTGAWLGLAWLERNRMWTGNKEGRGAPGSGDDQIPELDLFSESVAPRTKTDIEPVLTYLLNPCKSLCLAASLLRIRVFHARSEGQPKITSFQFHAPISSQITLLLVPLRKIPMNDSVICPTGYHMWQVGHTVWVAWLVLYLPVWS